MPLHIHYNFLRCQLVYNGKAPNLQPKPKSPTNSDLKHLISNHTLNDLIYYHGKFRSSNFVVFPLSVMVFMDRRVCPQFTRTDPILIYLGERISHTNCHNCSSSMLWNKKTQHNFLLELFCCQYRVCSNNAQL